MTPALEQRLKLYRELEQVRGHPLIVYVTSTRLAAAGIIASDAIGELLFQLQRLPEKTEDLDLLLFSHGGDPTVAWRLVSLVRERVKRFAVLIPEAAFSAATLIALGADEIVMHPHGNLGPVDPQITTRQGTEKEGEGPRQPKTFGSADLAAFLDFVRTELKISDQRELSQVFKLFCDEVGAVPIGVAARSSQLSVSMGEKLLRLHMTGKESQKPKAIAEALTKSFFHHGYPLNRTEAKNIGLKVVKKPEVEGLLWEIWSSLADEMEIRTPFNPLTILASEPSVAALFGPAPQVNLPANLPPAIAQQALQAILQQIGVTGVPPVNCRTINAMMESSRLASRFVTEGRIFSARTPDLQIRWNLVQERASWRDVWQGPEEKQ